MNGTQPPDYERCADELMAGFNDLPILARLQFVSDVLSRRAGDSGNPGFDPTLSALSEILDRTIWILEEAPGIANLHKGGLRIEPK